MTEGGVGEEGRKGETERREREGGRDGSRVENHYTNQHTVCM